MKIIPLNQIPNFYNLLEKDSNGREINIYKLKNVVPIGESLFYPNTLLLSKETGDVFKPINETVMSLKNIDRKITIDKKMNTDKIDFDDMFFFIYNTDNYFHFIYDSLPYLISYNKLKEKNPNIKLLMNYPNQNKLEQYKFVTEFLEILGVTDRDIKIIDGNTEYSSVIISTSYTHDFDSNIPPRKEIYSLYDEIKNKVKTNNTTNKKIYISRRTWLHNDFSNIGTNYTTRRKMINEDALVNLLLDNGYVEVFTENMTTEEKITMFSNAESIVGAIGGGICNVLFSNINCELIAIVSPHFLDINERFKFSINNVNLKLFNDVSLTEKTEFKTYMRVKVGDIIGEITEIDNENITISYSNTTIAGWNNDIKYITKNVKAKDCVKLDNGLNSPWKIDLDSFKEKYL
jgi:hypothetical protein